MLCADCLKSDIRTPAITILLGKAVCEACFPSVVESAKKMISGCESIIGMVEESSKALSATSRRLDAVIASFEKKPEQKGGTA